VRILPAGSGAVLVEPTDARRVVDLYRHLVATRPAGVTELVPAAATVLVVFDSRVSSRAAVVAWVERVATAERGAAGSAGEAEHDGEVVELPVRYDGPDLAVVAELCSVSVDDVITAHLGQLWTAAFIGFAPGFAYLTGEHDRLTVPRRETPRPAAPAGSVALAAGYCGVYPRESPGGWHIIGTTDAVLWDARRSDPALLAPSTRVRFVREH
jgi:KipI family sensor histidine kinase inhibitor